MGKSGTVNLRYPLYRVTPVGVRLVTQTGADFDERAYSRFKHGDGLLAQRYGQRLAAELLFTLPELGGGGEPIVVTSAPYKYLPTASHLLALEVHQVVNAALASHGRQAAEIGTLHMARLDGTNYATLDARLRGEVLAKAELYVNEGEFAGRHVVLVDDARITGLAEAAATELVMAAGARSVTSLHVVQIAENCAPFCPDVEDRINHAFVRDLRSLLKVFRSERFVLNIRTVKYVLGWPEHDELDAFFDRLAHAQCSAIYQAAMRTGSAFVRCYRESLLRLEAALGRSGPPESAPGMRAAAPGELPTRDVAGGPDA